MSTEVKTFHSANSQARLDVRRRLDRKEGLNLLVDHGTRKLGISLSPGTVRDLVKGLQDLMRVPSPIEVYNSLRNGEVFTGSTNPPVKYYNGTIISITDPFDWSEEYAIQKG